MMIKSEESSESPNAVPEEPVVPQETGAPDEATNKNPKPKPNYPRTSEMVNLAIKALSEKNGSSLQAIKKYMVETYKIDVEKQNLFIKKYLKSAVEAGFLIRTKGRGAAGSFKIPGYKIDPLKATSKKKSKAVKKTTSNESTGKKGKTLKAMSPKKEAKRPTKPKSPKTKKVASPKAKKTAAKTVKSTQNK